MNSSFVLAGHLIHTPTPDAFAVTENGFLVVENGAIAGCFQTLPERYAGLRLERFPNRLLIPGLCDTHIHAPQYAFRGLGMDLELLDWLNRHAYPEETRYADLAYAERAYGQFAAALGQSATTRASVFGTLHTPATLLLAKKLEKAGLRGYVGRVNMDRNAPDSLRETNAAIALKATEEWLDEAAKLTKIKPILTPRFVPACSDRLMDGLGQIRRERGLPLQSHLSENTGEIAWVKELCPDATCYADAYARHGLLDAHTVMAHCVHPTEAETALLKERDVLVAHCPNSNMNLCSGVAPIRRYLERGVRVGLGTDIAGGFELSVFRSMTDAVQVSKLRSHYDAAHPRPLSLPEAFYLGTKGGGALFGRVGSFEAGCDADIVVLDDSRLAATGELSVCERMERAIYLEKDVRVEAKYVAGERMEF